MLELISRETPQNALRATCEEELEPLRFLSGNQIGSDGFSLAANQMCARCRGAPAGPRGGLPVAPTMTAGGAAIAADLSVRSGTSSAGEIPARAQEVDDERRSEVSLRDPFRRQRH